MKKNNIFYILIMLMFSFFVVLLCTYFSQNVAFVIDDYDFGVFFRIDEKFYDSLFKDAYIYHGGGYFAFFLTRFLNFALPLFFNIHPADFIGFPQGLIKGCISLFIIFSLVKFSQIFYRSKMINIIIFLFCSILFFALGLNFDSIFLSNSYFYRYPLSLLFFTTFWYFIYTNIIREKNKINVLSIISICLSAFLLGSCMETAIFSSLLLVFLLVVYNILLHLCFKISKNEKLFSYKYKFDINFYIPTFILYLSAFLFTKSQGFQGLSIERGLGNFNFNFDQLKEFWEIYNIKCLKNEIIYWIIFLIIFGISLYYAINKKEIKNIIFPVLMQLSILTVMFSLFLCGKTMYDSNMFWIERENLIAFYKIQIHIPLFILFSYVIKNTKYKNYFFLVFIILLIPVFYNLSNTYTKYEELNKEKYQYKKENYIAEKILRYYFLQNKSGYINYKYLYKSSNWIPYWGQDIQEEFNTELKNIFGTKGNVFTQVYYPLIYGDNKAQELGYYFVEDAIEKFKKDGGILTEEELSKLQFNRLRDDNYVLKGK